MMEIILKFFDLVVMHLIRTMSRIFHKILATGLPVAKLYSNIITITWMKTMKKRMNQLILSLVNNKTDPYNDENAIDLRWSDVKWKILLWLTWLRACKSKLMRKFFKKVAR